MRIRIRLPGVLLLLTIVLPWLTSAAPQAASQSYAGRELVIVDGRSIKVGGEPYFVKGVGYAPTPIGIDPEAAPPYGDYFTAEYQTLYERDLPLLRAMGANTLRLWGWQNAYDHSDFLGAAYNNGVAPVRVIVTFWMGPSVYPDISSSGAREQIKADFRAMVAAHKDYPAVLMWAIGNELNASWMYGAWPEDLFSLINEMAWEAHSEEGADYHPVTTALMDANVITTITAYDAEMPDLDVWGVNLYRGASFGSFFDEYAAVSDKPLVILEFGVDAYDDVNGTEYEATGSPYQAVYAQALWSEIEAHSDIVTGGSIMAYSDEWWKGKHGEVRTGCPEYDPSFHSACGYATSSHPDSYSNEEWWGIMRTIDHGSEPDIMQPRAVYGALREAWHAELVYLPLVER